MDRKLKIAILGSRGIPNYYGGFEICAEEVSVRLVEKGHHISVFCEHRHPADDKVWKGVSRIKVFNPENKLGTFGQFIYDLKSNLHSSRKYNDIVLHLGYTSDSVWFPLWNKKTRHIVNMDGMEWKRKKYSGLVRCFLKQAEKMATIRANYLVADAIPIQSYLEKTYNHPVRYIPYGAHIPASIQKSVLNEYGLAENNYDLIIARMVADNNIEMAIQAKLQSQNDNPLIILGNDTGYRRLLIRKYSSYPPIRFEAANFNLQTINSLRAFCRYYIHGHSMGGTNPSLLEAMACRCRILAHDNPFNKSVTGADSRYFNSTEELCYYLNTKSVQLITEDHLEENLKKIREKYNWDRITDQYEELFYEVV